MTPLVGIDLGTTNSLCAVFQGGEPRLIPNAHGSVMTPSVVGVLEDGQVVVGTAARELRVTQPSRCAAGFKRLMGTNSVTELAGQHYTAPELSSLVLKSLKQDAETFLGVDVRQAVITVPAYFNDTQRKATKLAGELAGFHVRRIVNEPTAAALTYGFFDRQDERLLIVIDLGGGTFDVTTMEVFEGTLEIVSTAGESFLGGEDFTNRLVAIALESQGLQLESAELHNPLLVSRLYQECEAAKRKLLDEESAVIRIPDRQGEFDDNPQTITLDRASFAQHVDTLVKRLTRPISRAVRDSRRDVADYKDVILVGGATRMEAVRAHIRALFGVEPHCKFNPDEVVALGAAVQAALIEDDRAVDDIIMTDVCPFTLGVEISKQFGKRHASGFYLPVIHRNTTIPVSCEEVVSTVSPNQRTVSVRIFQGEARKVEENTLLGELEVKGIPPGPSGQEINLRFTYDLNGILEVEAYIPVTGRKTTTVLTHHAEELTSKEVDAAVKRMQQLKFYPRDDVGNRHLVLFAERVIGEISPFQRDELESAIDRFEHAMSSGNREEFEHAREGLLIILSFLEFPFDGTEAEQGDADRA